VNSLVSAKSALPIEYYSLPFCRPAKIVSSAENLGEARPARAGGDATTRA
jgi:transmembrane 9 superfamily protein 2/4